jgi:serine/threonine protein kinase
MHSKQVLHRDVKPANIMRCAGDIGVGAAEYKLIDLSIAAVELDARDGVSDTMQTGTTGLAAMVGTPHYMSPEQFTAGQVVSMQTDL